MSVIPAIRAFFDTPARQAAGWAIVGILGLTLAGGGLWLMAGDDGGGTPAVAPEAATSSPGATATRTATPSPTASPTATATQTATAAVTPRAQVSTGGAQATPEPTEEPAPEPTTPPVVAGGPYCNNISSSTPPNSILGTLKIAGANAPAGTVVTVLFDGVAGPSVAIAEAGGYKINWAAGGSECANRVGAAIAVAVNGQVFVSDTTVGGGGGTPVIRFDVAIP